MRIYVRTDEAFDLTKRCEKVTLKADSFNDERWLAALYRTIIEGGDVVTIERCGKSSVMRSPGKKKRKGK